MGLREAEEHISKAEKQIFQLKLELHSRRERCDVLEARVAKAEELKADVEELKADNKELRQINEDLLVELEKRGLAVDEAVALICDLETKIEEMEAKSADESRSYQTASNVAAPKSSSGSAADRPFTPNPSQAPKDKQHDHHIRSPSFLKEAKPSTSALRELYTGTDESTGKSLKQGKPSIRSLRRVGSFFSQDEYSEPVDADTFSLNHRRLSLLSESSFVSVYGKNKEPPTPSTVLDGAPKTTPTAKDDTPFTRELSPQEGRIKQWMENKDHPRNPKKHSMQSVRSDAFSSIGEVLRPTQRGPREATPSVSPTPSRKQPQRSPLQPLAKTSHPPSLAGPIFGSDVLPPTPGTMSTITLGGKSSNPSIIEQHLSNGVSRPVSGTTAVSSDSNHFGPSSGDRAASRQVPQQANIDTDTDIEESDDEQHPAQVGFHVTDSHRLSSSHLSDPSRGVPSPQVNRALYISPTKQPQYESPARDFMFNGEGIDSIRPARTLSYHSPKSSHHSTSKGSLKSQGQASPSSRDYARNGVAGESSAQQAWLSIATDSRVDAAPLIRPTVYRSASVRSHSSQTTGQVPTQGFASRLFRRNTSHPTPSPSDEAPTNPPDIPSPESKSRIRPPRPSSFYIRSASSQLPSPVPSKVNRTVRPGTSGGIIPDSSSSRRHSVAFGGNVESDPVANGPVNGQRQQTLPQQQQQQAKRLSVGAIGRSASLRIKEGFGRKKVP
ncbi:MAG: hypothetical protein Q9219_004128 [cf. Caloplaca sp. 3 TL-2023]